MRIHGRFLRLVIYCLVPSLALLATGCLSCQPCARALDLPDHLSCQPCGQPVPQDEPRELAKMSMPPYIVEPPDILLIDAVRVVPRPPYKIEPLDALFIQATNTFPTDPINGIFGVEPDGTISLGAAYGGSLRVAGKTTEEARGLVENRLKDFLKEPKVQVALAQSRAMQQIRGEHLVRPDGTVSLGVYGSVYIAGMTLEQAKATIEAHLSIYLLDPEIAIDVYAYNSKVFYIVFDGAGYGQQIYRLPITGNETVLDAISQVNGLPAVASRRKIWVARPGQADGCEGQVMPVDWQSVVMCGASSTNYQLFPGDRLYIQSDRLIAFDNFLAKVISPIERVFGISLLGQQTILSFDRSLQRAQGNRGGF